MLPDLTSLYDRDLIARVESLVATDRQTTALLLVHLAEVEDRRLYVQAACTSLFSWCVGVLNLSEDAASKRIRAARLVKRFPALYPALVDGRLHLAGIALLGSSLTEANQDELIAAAAGKSKRQIEQLLADREPKPDVPTRNRPVPRRRSAARPSPQGAPETPAGCDDQGGLFRDQQDDGASAQPEAAPEREGAPPSPGHQERGEKAKIDPLGDLRFKVQFTASAELVSQIELATSLLSHRMPVVDLAVVVQVALALKRRGTALREAPEGTLRRSSKGRRAQDLNRPRGQSSARPGSGPRGAALRQGGRSPRADGHPSGGLR